LVTCDLLDNLAYGAVSARTGRLLDELAPLDAAFRRVGGRRNVYVWILLIGVWLRRGSAGFLVASGWAFVTAAVHIGRAAYWLLHGDEPVVGTLVSEK
jgi:hypothetical protein